MTASSDSDQNTQLQSSQTRNSQACNSQLRSSRQRGEQGEELAARFLEARGYRIIERNWRPTLAGGKRSGMRGEIDCIAWQPSPRGEILCFIEVKTRASDAFGTPQEAVTPSKQRQICRLANAYVSYHPTNAACRFDVVEVWLSDDNRTPRIALHTSAFDYVE